MKAVQLTSALGALAIGLLAMGGQGPESELEKRVAALEARVTVLEKIHAAPQGQKAHEAKSSIVSVRLTRKEAQRENPMLDYYNLVFDVEFTGTPLLGERRIRDVKGTLYFDDAFGEEIIGASMTKRLGIGAGQKKVINRLTIEYTTVEFSKEWKRVLTTDMSELRVRFVVDRVIYEGD